MLLVFGVTMSVLHLPNWCEVAGLTKKLFVAFATVMLSDERNTAIALLLLAGTAIFFFLSAFVLYKRYECGIGFKVRALQSSLRC